MKRRSSFGKNSTWKTKTEKMVITPCSKCSKTWFGAKKDLHDILNEKDHWEIWGLMHTFCAYLKEFGYDDLPDDGELMKIAKKYRTDGRMTIHA